ncbi:MAG: uracil-DNA glycosylase family protein [Planctomycetota bacterium]
MAEANSDQIDANQLRQQAASLAAHLQRCGVQWLPNAEPESVEAISAQLHFDVGEQVVEESASSKTVSSKTASSKTVGSKTVVKQSSETKAQASPASTRSGNGLFALSGEEPGTVYPGELLDASGRVARLAAMSEQVATCTRCEMLAKCRTKTVFGEGSETPRFAFFGEGPGRDEDLSGRPFVGKAGQLLTKMIEACKLQRDDVYIMNTVKCRPPNNRNPEPAEVDNCREYFEEQFNVLRPDYIICLGLVSTKALFPNTQSVGRMRGRLHRYFESKVLVTYHPSYLLRTPAAKKAAWEDLQLMLRDAGLL